MKLLIKKNRTYEQLFWVGVLVFVLSNAYFGWNKTAQSGAERVFDIIWQATMFVGIFGMTIRKIVTETLEDMLIIKKD